MAKLEFLIGRLARPVPQADAVREETCGTDKRHQETPAVEKNNGTAGGGRISKSEEFVTRQQFTEALGHAERRLETRVLEHMGTQMLAIGSLRTMIANTDSLLERVLGRLESSALDSNE